MRRFGRMCVIVLVGLGSGSIAAAGEVVVLAPEATGLAIEAGESELLHVTVSELTLEGIEIDNASWAVVRAPDSHNLMMRGLPSLPYLASEYLLGRTDGVALELADSRVREIDLGALGFAGVAPSKGHFDRGTDPATVPWVFDDKVYGSAAAFPFDHALIGRPFISGPIRGQALQVPVAFWRPDTNTLTVVEEARYRVVHLPDAANPRLGPDRPLTGAFDAAVRLHAVNYSSFRGRTSPFVEAGRQLIIVDDDFVDDIQPFAEWQTLVGYPTVVVPTSAAGTTAAAVKTTIQSFYDEPEGLAWIVLVGDSPQIPTLTGVHSQHSPCDPCFTKLEGTDNRPDAAISRISAVTGDQVAVQAAKILGYEQLPDAGSAGAWTQAGFGIGSDDTGGTGLADWQRIELLRTDLMAPGYSYTEFDQIYHSSATSSQVANAVNAGRGLGLYIGHGWSGGWSTTGFDTSDVHNLTNADLLPTIWSVACNNGEFTVNECFGEAWLRDDEGGAVSFEGGTTTESWVPPCDAQRGIVDALRLETAFTTGGQHMAGKHHVMDVHGDSSSSEGNKWVEQSTLFGACTTWMRTLPAVAPDEPDDFSSAGGTASLTVKVGGAPLAKANAAIVSFFDDAGGAANVLGSGLIDANGHVTAAVTGDPTHCHIHGQNLIPTSYEFGAREAGRVGLDAPVYPCSATVTVRVADSNVPGSSPVTIDTTTAELEAGGSAVSVTLTETAADRSIYTGAAVLGADLVVGHGDVLTVTYIDANDGVGGINVPRTAESAIDCRGPTIADVAASATESSVTFSFTTDEPGTTVVLYGSNLPPAVLVEDSMLVTDHEITVDGVDPCTAFFFEVRTADALGNLSVDSNGGAFYVVESAGWGAFLVESFDVDPGWAIDNGGFPTTGWAWGQPTGDEQDGYGGPDPTSGFTGPYVAGVNLAGDAPASVGENELTLTTPAVDLSDATSAQLRFMRWLGVERDWYDNARIRLSVDNGASWQEIWDNDETTIDDQAWLEQVVPLPEAVGHSEVRVQWTYGSADGYWQYCGWNIDDVVIEGAMPCDAIFPLFADGFETGDCTRWSELHQ